MRLRFLFLLPLVARLAAAQSPDARRADIAAVSGVVRDSIARTALGGAIVQLVAADNPARFSRSVISDSMGRFVFGEVPDGRYMLGFLHAMLDSLGIEPPLHEVAVVEHRPVRADLGIPSPVGLRAAVCGARTARDSGAVIMGVVRDARDRSSAAGVTVTGDWHELSFTPEGVVRRSPRLVATTAANGWFAMCNVPSAGTMSLSAGRGADSTDVIEVQVPAERFLRRELYLGPRTAEARLSGTVVTIAEGRPLVGAQVSINGGPNTRANERGEWTLVGAPAGTRMLEVRAVGYYPARQPVNVIETAAPVRVELFTLKAMLDTVNINATHLRYAIDRTGFEQRRRNGLGKYLTEEEIARRHSINTSELLRTIPGVRVEYDSTGTEKQIVMRSAFTSDAAAGVRDFGKTWCSPAFYIDGNYMSGLSADAVDTWVRPNELVAIEVYTEGSIPAQFHWTLSDCGAIVIWTKRPVHRAP